MGTLRGAESPLEMKYAGGSKDLLVRAGEGTVVKCVIRGPVCSWMLLVWLLLFLAGGLVARLVDPPIGRRAWS